MKNYIKKLMPLFLKKLYTDYFRTELKWIDKRTMQNEFNILDYFKNEYNYHGLLGKIYSESSGMEISKWAHYIPIYDELFSKYRNKTKLNFLEIGVCKGGSLNMWRKYFGPDATIYGIDIDEECIKFDNNDGQVRIGSQVDFNFLDDVFSEMGEIDIVLDDGSHQMKHVTETFNHLFPKINNDGLYVIEDLHTAFWKIYGGGYNSKSNFFSYMLSLTKDMHHWYHNKGAKKHNVASQIKSIQIFDSIVSVKKQSAKEPLLLRKT